ncbi:MAG: hypothetical protein EBY51_05440 [Actinobacteria bacterium]|nr:hypothetical protein [Actinomycetota bacterium]
MTSAARQTLPMSPTPFTHLEQGEAMAKLMTVIKQFAAKPNNALFAAAARPHDPADYSRPALDGSGPAAGREPLADGAPDLRGVWEVVDGRMKGHVERIEQAGNRITITVGGLVHDMFCDGTLENGVDDIAGFDGDRIRVAATFEDGVHKLRPFGRKVVAVTRRLDGDELVWRYGPFRNRLRRLAGPPLDHPATRAAAEAAGTLPG